MTGFIQARAPSDRLRELVNLGATQQRAYVEQLLRDCPIRSWPFGMPTSAAPIAVVLGVSPGNRPSSLETDADIDPSKAYPPPTFGEPNRGLMYNDESSYWSKTRALLAMLVRRFDNELTEDQALALAGQLNLGLAMKGSASPDAIEPPITAWVSRVLTRMQPRTVVGLGLVGLLVNPRREWQPAAARIRTAWSEGGLLITWEERGWKRESASVNGHAYSFRVQDTLVNDQRTTFVLWPNHPSQAPFGGPGGPGSRWAESIEAARTVLRGGREWEDPA